MTLEELLMQTYQSTGERLVRDVTVSDVFLQCLIC